MPDKTYSFDLPPQQKSIIKVIGVGGGGSNAVNHMFNQGIKDVEFFVCNTDVQALQSSPVPSKIQIGTNLTQGLGAGANPEKGKAAAIESKEEIRDVLSEDTRMLFITAGMGGGTGTGAAPEIAKVAKELGVLTVGIVTQPFGFEGRKKIRLAEQGLAELRENCDTVLVILNDKLREVYSNLSLSNAFAQADNVLSTAAKSIAEIITLPGYINVDFEDVKTVMANSGAAVMGSARAEGDQRSRRAAEMALSSPLLDNVNIRGAQKILLSIKSGDKKEIQMEELDEITSFIHDECGQDAEMIFGHGMDPELDESVMVTVIATGFKAAQETDFRDERPEPRPQAQATPQEVKRVVDLESSRPIRTEPVRTDPVGPEPPPPEQPPSHPTPRRSAPGQVPHDRRPAPPPTHSNPDATESRPVEPHRPSAPAPTYQAPRPPAHAPTPEPPATDDLHPDRTASDHPSPEPSARPEPPVRRWDLDAREDELPSEETSPASPPREYRWENVTRRDADQSGETRRDADRSGQTWSDVTRPERSRTDAASESHQPSSGEPPASYGTPDRGRTWLDGPNDAPRRREPSEEDHRGRASWEDQRASAPAPRHEDAPRPPRDEPPYETHRSSSEPEPLPNEEQELFQRELSYKKKLLIEEAYARKMKMRGHKSISAPDSSQEQFQKENFSEPAYMRKNVHLYSTPPSNDQNVSRYSLDDENNIVSNNRFLHDNVD